ncbi:hypothetical protein K144316041_p21370 (plasmid) [Clostridium tetani]|uniref:hypothetical protein n=1 Tax=Clostridium tetani TaxID=1513 RepID=UPI00295410AA|nr:hypothetical protein [Clostridium tetani]BDR74298.1 hypothetical protein K144316041_p21370 [Clostridium tetani]
MFYKINNVNFKTTVMGEELKIPEIERELGMHKDSEDMFVITDIKTGAKISKGKTKNKVIKEAIKVKALVNGITPEWEECLANELERLVDERTFKKYKELFSATFRYDIITFCDLLALNKNGKVKVNISRLEDMFRYEPDYRGINLKEYIKNKYGDRVLEAVEYFI